MKTKERKIELKMPPWGLPLYGQVLAWFFVNLAVVGLVLWFVLKWHFGVDPSQFLLNRLRDDVEARADLVAGELRDSPQEDWEGILSRFGEVEGLQFSVLLGKDDWVGEAGLPAGLRQQASDSLKELRGRREQRPPRLERSDLPRVEELFTEFPEGERPAHRPSDVGAFDGPPPNRGEAERRPSPSGNGPESEGATASEMVFARSGGEGRDRRKWAATLVHLGNDRYRHPPQAILVFYSEGTQRDRVFVDLRPLIVVGAGLVALSGVLWLPFVHRVTKRLRVMTEGAERISEGDFAVNVVSRRGDEIGRLSRAIQRMAERLSILVDGQKRFLGDTAHELCSPLVRMRMGLGVLEQRLDGADRERLLAVEEEVGELARLVDELLDFSKASLAKGKETFQPCFLHELCEEVCQREAVEGHYTISGGLGLEVSTNADLLKRALGNVVRNAVRYAGGDDLELVVEPHGGEIWIGVLDRGPGLPEEWTERVFEPFARPDAARTREGGGAGLGLAIVKTCMDSLGGRVFCRNRQTGGLEVVLVLPAKQG